MADRWSGSGMRAAWLRCWFLFLTAVHMVNTETHRASAAQIPLQDLLLQMRNQGVKNISLYDLVGQRRGRVHPPPFGDATTRLPEFLPDGPRPFIPEPSFMSSESDIVVQQDDLAMLPCTVQNLGTRQISWNKVGGDHFLSVGTDIWVQDSNLDIAHYSWPAGVSDWNLVFKKARVEDSGLYECKVITTEKMVWQVRLTVLEKPFHKPEISIEGKEFVESGQTVYLKCNATEGDRMPEDVDWFKDGDKIEAGEYPNMFITKFRSKDTMALVSELMIASGTSNDSGTYICRSSSDLIASVEVNVLVADSSNVKRGTGVSHTQTGNGHNNGKSVIRFHFSEGSPLLFCIVFVVCYILDIIIS